MQTKNKFYESKNIIFSLFIVFLLFCTETIYTFAGGETVITSTTDDDGVYLYLKGIENLSEDTVTVQIGNTVCDNVAVMGLDGCSIPMRTVILIDNSLSIRAGNRTDIQNILIGLTEQSMAGEEYRIGTFSNSITWLTEYSSDYELMKSAINSIQYENQNTYFNDCLYHLIEEINSNHDEVYTRVIMISDGADDQGIGYTGYEVNALVEKSNIPVYMIGTPGDNKALETMFSYARASGADHYQLGAVSNEDVINGLLADHGLMCVHIIPDAGMLDGSQKNIQVILSAAEGEIRLTATVNMPFAAGNVPVEEPEASAEEEPEVEEEESEQEQAQPLPVLGGTTETDAAADNTDNDEQGFRMTLLIVIISAVVIAAAAAVVLMIVIRKKKQKVDSENTSSGIDGSPSIASTPFDVNGEDDKTLLISINSAHKDENATRMLLGQPMQQQTPTVFLVLKSLDRANTEFRVPIRDAVRIGRKNTDIVVDFDKHISSNHCEIIKRGELMYIKDLGSLNGTFYENIQVLDQEIPIVDGGTIRLGNSKFKVTLDKQG